jgi:hypothetical protein
MKLSARPVRSLHRWPGAFGEDDPYEPNALFERRWNKNAATQ